MATTTIILPAMVISGCVTILWLVSLRLRDASIVDIWWGPGFAVIGWIVLAQHPDPTHRLWLVTALLTLWALRLGIYLGRRNLGHAEDKRYQAIRAKTPGFPWVSLVSVFFFQGALQLFVSMPVYGIAASTSALNALDLIAVLLTLAGISLEATADHQLAQFKRAPGTTDSVLRSGVWGWCRHPNYFGNALLWLGVGVLALAGGSPWWTAAGPAVMWFLLLKVSGVSMLERTIVDRRPEYRRYIEEVPAFFPNPFSRR